MAPEVLHPFFLLADLVLACGAALALGVHARERRVLGGVTERVGAGIEKRLVPLLGVAGGVGSAWLARADVPLLWSLPTLGLAALFLLVSPSALDRVTGRQGVRRGWYVRGFGELEEWRVTGDHLRFRLRGLWEAVPLARERQAEVEARLRALAPDRESRFK
jgi:hypothetical protein